MTNMASLELITTNCEDKELENFLEIQVIAVPTPGTPPLLLHSGDEAYETILKVLETNKLLVDRATEIDVEATRIVGALRGLANLFNLDENKCNETNLYLNTIANFVKKAENNIDLAFKIKRIKLLKFDSDKHIDAETDLATAAVELERLKEDLDESLKQMKKLEIARKVVQDCINIGHDILALQ